MGLQSWQVSVSSSKFFKGDQMLPNCFSLVEWHVERGLRLNIDGSPCLSGRAVNVQQIATLPQINKKSFQKEAKMQTFCISCFKQGT